MPKINIEDYSEESEQGRYFRGKMTLDKICTYCGGLLTFEQYSCFQEPCQHCGSGQGWLMLNRKS